MQWLSFMGRGKGFNREKKVKTEASWRVFSLKELHAATNSFNYDNKLGQGRFGSVYWGQLWDGSQIAVKRLKVWNNKEETDFAVEIEKLTRIRHENLSTVRGYCAEGQERLIVYEYMPNLSLVSHLHGQQSAECLLDWKRRMHIATGSAQAIAYLHQHPTRHIVHGAISANNVLLDSDFEARVSDFGLCKLMPDDTTETAAKAKGNVGYIAPEYATSGEESEKNDVYGFGILMLELVSGKRPVAKVSATTRQTIKEWVLPLARERKYREVADHRLNGEFVEVELRRVVVVGLMCAHREVEKRPTMVEVVEMLRGESKDKLDEAERDEFWKNSGNLGKGEGEVVSEKDMDVLSEEKDPRGG